MSNQIEKKGQCCLELEISDFVFVVKSFPHSNLSNRRTVRVDKEGRLYVLEDKFKIALDYDNTKIFIGNNTNRVDYHYYID